MTVQKKGFDNHQIIIVSVVTALSLIGDSFLYIALPIYWKDIGLTSIWEVGFLLSINRFIRLPANPLIGWLYQKITLRTGLIIAVTLGSLTTIGYGIVQGFSGLVILRGLWGIAWSFFRIGGLSTVVHFANENSRGKAMGLYNGIYRLGSLIGMLLGGVLVSIFGFTIISITFGIISFIGLPLIIGSLKAKPAKKEIVSDSKKIRLSFRYIRPTLMVIVSGFFITMLIQGVLTSTLSKLIEKHYGESTSLFGMTIGVVALSGLIQSIRWVWEPFLGSQVGKWSDGKYGRIPIFVSSLFISSLAFGLLSIQIPLTIWIILILITMISATSLTTLSDTLAGDIAKTTNAVSFLTLYSVVQDIGAAIGPFTAYYFIEKANGFHYLYWGGSIILFFLTITWTIKHFKSGFHFHQKKSLFP